MGCKYIYKQLYKGRCKILFHQIVMTTFFSLGDTRLQTSPCTDRDQHHWGQDMLTLSRPRPLPIYKEDSGDNLLSINICVYQSDLFCACDVCSLVFLAWMEERNSSKVYESVSSKGRCTHLTFAITVSVLHLNE